MSNELIESVHQTFQKVEALVTTKNQDYGANEDLFRNFRMVQMLGLSVEHGILVRLLDKVARINNLLTHDPAVTSETMGDSIDDAIGYLAILKAYRERHSEAPIRGDDRLTAPFPRT